MTSFSHFKKLHYQSQPLLIGNVWNVQSTKIFETLHFQAIGTSSAAIAHSLGYTDGGQMPFSELLYMIHRIKQNTSLPLTVDMEHGYGTSASQIAARVTDVYKAGAVGINLEDSLIENNIRSLQDAALFSQQLKQIRTILEEANIPLFINVRCDAFLLQLPQATEVALQRMRLYEAAGADGLFLPGLTEKNLIEQIAGSTQLPLNVMCMPGLPDFETLSAIGVRRISMGNFLNAYCYSALEAVTTDIVNRNSFSPLF